MNLFTVGVNHLTAPLDVRSRFAIAPALTLRALDELKRTTGVRAAAILSTCNRTELFLSGVVDQGESALNWLHRFQGLEQRFDNMFYRHQDQHAVRHVFRVAAGLDSMVLGEPQILGQLKHSYRLAQDAASLAHPLEQLLQKSFSVAKEVRFETGLGRSPISVAFAAVRAVEQVFDDLSECSVLLIGAGETAALVGTHLRGRGARRITIANRNVHRATDLALRLEASTVELSRVPDYLTEADIIVAATGASEPLVRAADYAMAIRRKRRKLRLLVDLGVPRNIEAGCQNERDTMLFAMDDLQAVVSENKLHRARAAEQAEMLVESRVQEFMSWCAARERLEPLKLMRAHNEKIAEESLQEAVKHLRQGQPPEQVVFHLVHSLSNRFQHQPSLALQRAAAAGDQDTLQAALRLFGLNDAPP